MSQYHRLMALKKRHAALDKKILEEQKYLVVNVVLIKEMKKQKLHLKDEIAWLERLFDDEIEKCSSQEGEIATTDWVG